GVINPGLQIVAIQKDLADEVSAHINPSICLEMECASSAKNWTLSCAEYLMMKIGDIPFYIHTHVVKHAPFHILLRQPFQKLLTCVMEDMPDGSIDVTVCNP
ncbi:hypothetical protein BJV74DRAFT_711094, partial [Russula compacta]